MSKQGTTRLTNPRDPAEHKHDTLPIVAKHGSNAASSSDFPKQATHEPSTNCPKANARDRSSLPSSSTPRKEQLRPAVATPQQSPNQR
ncbi:hypothetical protein C2845_PM03G31240 [Panicum miliaceum]|uniref:Uncharacterized protein n=1 Tax=Panicum miliaceum TaxID=4540 RepID=A0A3L6T795_PANMI|nr:hypothetical protein C2845_PM03G31240 [Panicum miliaceum]